MIDIDDRTEGWYSDRIRVRFSRMRRGVVTFRNQVGQYELRDGRILRSGLAVGSSDLIGWLSIEFHGVRLAIFLAVEVKKPGKKPTKEQAAFLDAVRAAGGVAGWADSPEMAEKIVLDFLDRLGLLAAN